MMHASTSPFYPCFALDINARMHREGRVACNMWMDCVVTGIEARKLIPELPVYSPVRAELVDGRPWKAGTRLKLPTDLALSTLCR